VPRAVRDFDGRVALAGFATAMPELAAATPALAAAFSDLQTLFAEFLGFIRHS
jgi:hypothetical protein